MLFGRQTRIGSHALSILILPVLAILTGFTSVFGQSDPLQARITVASGVRVRTAPQTTSEELTRLPIGTLFTPLERTTSREKVSNSGEFWYRMKSPDGKEGWVFGGFTAPVQSGAEDVAYTKLARERLKIEDPQFADMVDLVEFLTRVSASATDTTKKSEFELDRLLAVKKLLTAIPVGDSGQAKYQKWIKDHESELIYSEPGGQWMVKSELFWGLQKKYAKLPIAEQIAWAASQNPLPGECEGFLDCEIGMFNLTEGRYLNLYPSGAHAEQALTLLTEDIKSIFDNLHQPDVVQVSDKSDLHKEMGLAKATLEKTSSPRKQKLIEELNQIESRVK